MTEASTPIEVEGHALPFRCCSLCYEGLPDEYLGALVLHRAAFEAQKPCKLCGIPTFHLLARKPYAD